MRTTELHEAYQTLKTWENSEWVRLALVAELTGCSPQELAGAVQAALADESFRAEPQPHRHRLGAEDHRYAVPVGGEPRHLIRWGR